MSNTKVWTMRDIEKQDDSQGIYVRNNAPKNSLGFMERIIVAVPKDGMEGSDLVSIPGTNIPWELTAQVTRTSLLRSSDFRNAVRRGLLIPINPTEAEEIHSRPAVQEDIRALIASEEAHSMEDINSPLDGGGLVSANIPRDVASTTPTSAAGVHAPKGVNETVFAIMETAGTQTEAMVITSLRGVPNKTLADYRYIFSRARDMEFSDLEGRAAKKIQALEEEANDDV